MEDPATPAPVQRPDDLLDVAAFAKLIGFGKALARHRIGTDGLACGMRDGEPVVTRATAEAFKVRYDEVQAALAEMYEACMDPDEACPGPGPTRR